MPVAKGNTGPLHVLSGTCDGNCAETPSLKEIFQKVWGNSIFLLLDDWEPLPDDELTDVQREMVNEVRRVRRAPHDRDGGK